MNFYNFKKFNLILGIVLSSLIGNIYAADFHWDGITDDLTLSTNWTPAGPPGAGNSGVFDLMSLSSNPSVNSAVFLVDSFQYPNARSFNNIIAFGSIFRFTKEGIINIVGGANQNFTIFLSTIQFLDSTGKASDNGATVFYSLTDSQINFFNGSTAGSSANINGSNSTISFNASKAGSSIIIGNSNSNISFTAGSDSETAALIADTNSTINFTNSIATNSFIGLTNSFLVFDSSNAGSSNINSNASTISYINNSNATSSSTSAFIGSNISFDASHADSATISLDASFLTFNNSSSGDSAQITTNHNSTVLIDSNSTTANTIFNIQSSTISYDHGANALAAFINPFDNSVLNFGVNTLGGTSHLTVSDSLLNYNLNSQAQATTARLFTSTATFSNTSQANTSTFETNNSNIIFQDSSSANTASIHLGNNSTTSFNANSTAASSSFNIDSGSTLSFLQSSADTFSGSVTGQGTIIKNSPSRLNFTANGSSFNGQTQVNSGTFALNGILRGLLTINGPSILQGIGTANNVVINNGATIAPGNSIGTFHVGGNFTQNPGSFYLVELNGALQSDLIAINGTATLNGGTVNAVSTDGTFVPFTPYTIVHADGGVNGTYTPGTFFTDPMLAINLMYDPNNVFLVLGMNMAQIIGQTPNQKAVARQIDSIMFPTPAERNLINNLLALDPAQQRNALDQMGGEQYTSLVQITHQATQRFLRRMYDPLRDIIAERTCYNPCANNVNFWATAEGGHSTLTHDRNAHGYQVNDFNFTVGAQQRCSEQWTFGTALAYDQDWVHYSLGGHGHLYTTQGALYAAYTTPCFYAFSDFDLGETYCNIKRRISFANINETANGKTRIFQTSSYIEIGKNFFVNNCITVQPFVGIEAGYYHRRGFHERNADILNLNIKARNLWIVTSRLGIHAQAALNYGIEIATDLAWQHNYDFNRDHFHANFESFGSEFEIIGVRIDHDSIDAALNISADVNNCLSVYADVSTQAWNRYANYSVTGGLQYNW